MPWNSTDQSIAFPLTTVEEACCITAFEFNVGENGISFMHKPPSFQDVKDCIPRNFANISRRFSVMYIKQYFQKLWDLLRSWKLAFWYPYKYGKLNCRWKKYFKWQEFNIQNEYSLLLINDTIFTLLHWVLWCVIFMKYRHTHSYSILTYSVSN